MEQEQKSLNESINKSKNKINLKSKFLSKLMKEILLLSNKNDYIDDIFSKDSIDDSSILKSILKKVKAYSDEFENFDESKINIFDLRRGLAKEAMKLENARFNYLQVTSSKFELNEKQQDKLKKEIKKLDEKTLNKLIFNENNNLKFLKKLFGDDVSILNKLTFLDTLTKKDIEERLFLLEDPKRKNIEQILYNLSVGKIYDSDLKDLFLSGFLKENEKKQILKTFIPAITLKQALDLGLLSSKEVKKQKEKILKSFLSSKNIDDKFFSDIIESASLEDIKVDIDEFLSNKENLDKISNGIGFSHIEQEFKEYIKNSEKELVKNGPKTFLELKGFLGKNFGTKFENLKDFEEGNVIKIYKSGKNGKIKTAYLRIEQISDSNRNISLRGIGDNLSGKEVINFSSNAQLEFLTYSQFIKWIQTLSKGVFYKQDDLQKQIKEGKINAEISDLKLYSKEDLKKNKDFEKKIREEFHGDIKRELNFLENQLKQVEDKINLEEKKDKKQQDKNLLNSLKIKKENLKQRIKLKKEELNNISKSGTKELLGILNKNELVKKIDIIDSQGKGLGLSKGLFIGIKQNGKKVSGLYKITGVDWEDGFIYLESKDKKGLRKEKINLNQFYESFKKNNAFRVKPLLNLEDLFKENLTNSSKKEIWANYEIKNNEIHIKKIPNGYDTKNTKVDYLIKNDSNDIIKIEKVEGEYVKLRTGERKDASLLTDKEAKKYKFKKNKNGKYNGELILLSKDTVTIPLSELNNYINLDKKEYTPDWEIGKKNKQINKIENLKNGFHGDFFTKFFNGFSLMELYSGLKTIIDGVEEYFKKGNDIHAAQLALKMGKFLPEEVRHSLQIKVESAEKEAMDKEIQGLGAIDSALAVKKIRSWLLNKDTPEFKKEAGLMFVLEKYGTLTGKAPLYEFKGKFMWYEAFGGRIGDELYRKVEKEMKDKGQSFSEEYLLYNLIKEQAGGKRKPKRRSRLHKDFDAKWGKGIKDELQSGYDDASKIRSAKDILAGGNGELFNGNLPNAVGWYKKLMEAGASLKEMNEGFFLMLFSGALYSTDQKVYTQIIKPLWGEGIPQILARMSLGIEDMKLFNRTILALSREIEKREPEKYKGIYSKAKEIYAMVHSIPPIGTEKERLQKSKDFWDSYGDVLSRSLSTTNGVLDPEVDNKFINTDKILLEKSREQLNTNMSQDELTNDAILKKYYDKMKDYSAEGVFKKDFMETFGLEGIGGMNILENTKKWFRFDSQGTPIEGGVLDIFFERFASDIERQKNKDNIIQMLAELVTGILINSGLRDLEHFNKSTTNIGARFNKWGLYIKKDFGNFAPKDVLSINPEVKSILSRVADNIIGGGLNIGDEHYFTGIEELVDSTKQAVDKVNVDNIEKEYIEEENKGSKKIKNKNSYNDGFFDGYTIDNIDFDGDSD